MPPHKKSEEIFSSLFLYHILSCKDHPLGAKSTEREILGFRKSCIYLAKNGPFPRAQKVYRILNVAKSH